jgi:hypothetical protein
MPVQRVPGDKIISGDSRPSPVKAGRAAHRPARHNIEKVDQDITGVLLPSTPRQRWRADLLGGVNVVKARSPTARR